MKASYFLVCWTMWFSAIDMFAQEQKTRAAANPIESVDALNDSSFYSRDHAMKRMFALKAQGLARKAGYKKGLADSYVRLGQAYAGIADWEPSEQHYRTALRERGKLGNKPDIASCYNELGRLFKAQERYDTAIVLFRQGLAVMENETPHLNTVALNTHLGHLYRLTGQYEKAQQHLEAAIKLSPYLIAHPPEDYTAEELELRLTAARLDMAEFMQAVLHQYPPAKDSLIKCLQTYSARNDLPSVGKCLLLLGNNAYYAHELDSAQYYCELGLALGDQIKKEDRNTLYRNRGRIFLDRGNYKNAMGDFKASIAGFEQQGLLQHAAAVRAEIGNLFYEQSEADSAVSYYKLALSQGIADPILRGKVLYFLSDILYQADNDAESQEYAKEYVKQLDKLQTSDMRLAFSDMNMEFLEKNRMLRRINERAKQTERQYSLLALGISGLLIVLALLLARLHRQKRRLAESTAEIARQNAEKAEKDAKIARQQEQLVIKDNLELLKNREVETAYARIEGSENMQQKIGQDLHDSVGAMLSTVRLQLSPVDEVLDVLPGKTREQFISANQLLSEACEEVRRISHELSSAVLRRFGLKAQLEALCEVINQTGKLQVELATHGLNERLNSKAEINIYRMVQELVNNTIKHAQAQNLSIQVNRFEDTINIMVEDDGVGFDVDTAQNSPGLGLQSLAARVHELHGEMQIDSRLHRGSTISIDIPTQKAL